MAMNPVITIAGCGPGAPELVTPAAREAAAEADTLVGASRLLELFGGSRCEKIPVGADIEGVLRAIEERYRTRRVVVLVTGDPGLCSLALPVLKRFGREHCRVIPGISAVQAAFAAVGLDWLDARIIDAHGKVPESGALSLREEAKLAVLMGTRAAAEWTDQLVRDLGDGYRVWLCEDLTLPEEQIREVVPGALAAMTPSNRSILICCRKEKCV